MSRQFGIGSGQIVGERERQEDAVASAVLRRHGTVALVLADGMGGHAGGDVAAKLATRTVLAHLRAGAKPPVAKLRSALAAGNDAIRRAVASNPGLDGMGCTLVAATISQSRLRWISVGDTVLFLIRGGRLSRLNADHSMRPILDDLVARGQLDEADAARNPTRNALRSAVSGEMIELIDAPDTDVGLKDGDIVLIASDGVETLNDSEIAAIAARAANRDPQRIVDDLLREVSARRVRHQDNASALAYIHSSRHAAHPVVVAAVNQRRVEISIAVVAAVLLSVWAVVAFEFRAYLGTHNGGPIAAMHVPASAARHRGSHAHPGSAMPAPVGPPAVGRSMPGRPASASGGAQSSTTPPPRTASPAPASLSPRPTPSGAQSGMAPPSGSGLPASQFKLNAPSQPIPTKTKTKPKQRGR